MGKGGCCKLKVCWHKLGGGGGAGRVVASHWLGSECLSLAGLLLGEEEAFFPPAGIVKCIYLQGVSFPVARVLRVPSSKP